MRHGSLFSGIGGFDLAAEWMGWTNVFHCEWNEFGQKVLKYYWPNAISYGDITKTDFSVHRGNIDIITGGFPCQPYSAAGKRKGTEDSRHLWPEMLRAIREIQPRYVVGENVRGLTNWNGGMVFDQVQADLEAEGFEVLPFLLPAGSVNAPHRRDRIWFIAHSVDGGHWPVGKQNGETYSVQELNRTAIHAGLPDGTISIHGDATHANNLRICQPDESAQQQRGAKVGGSSENIISLTSYSEGKQNNGNGSGRLHPVTSGTDEQGDAADTRIIELQGRLHQNGSGTAERHPGTRDTRINQRGNWDNFPTQSPVCGGNDGLPSGLSGITVSKHRKESLMAYGNSIVPQLALQIFKAIEATENELNEPRQILL